MAINYDEATGNYTDGVTTLSRGKSGAYEIGTLDQLKLFRDAVNAGRSFNGETVKLTDSIDLKDEEWTPIGKSGATFQGTFDGQGNTVSNLKITRATSNFAENCGIGFFGYTNAPATITDLTINNVDITGSLYIGAVVGYGYTGKEISNCRVTGLIEIEGWWYIGGIGGNGYVSKVSDCSVVGKEGSYIKAVSYGNEVGSYVGGIWGFRGEGGQSITDSLVSNIAISGTDRVGGICGNAHYGNTIEGCTIQESSISTTNNIGNVGLIAGSNEGNEKSLVFLLNNSADTATQEKFTINGDIVENPPLLGANDYNGDPAEAGIIGTVEKNENGEITGGTLTVVGTEKDSIDVSSKLDLADGLAFYPNSDGTIGVDTAGDVAMIGETRYESLTEAVAVVKPGETITILTDITEETVSMTGFGIASWNNSTFTTTKKLAVDAGANVLSGNVESAQLMLTGSKEENRTLTITESANVDLYIKGELTDGLLDVGFSLSKDVVKGDTGPRVYYAHVLVAGDVSVKRYKSDGNAESGAIYIRPYSELVVTGKLDVVGEVHNRGSLVVNGGQMTMSKWLTPKLLGYTTGDSMTVTKGGLMEIYDAGAVTFGEASASQQHWVADAQYADGMFATISAGGQFVADTLAFANDEDVTLTVTGEDSIFKLYSADGRTVAGGYTYAQNEGEIIIEDNAVFDVSELANDNFVNTGTIDISSATATFATLTNNGTVNVTGNATLAAEFMAAGTGLLNLNSVAFGSGTSVNDTASYTNNTIGSEIVMTGTNTLTDGAFVSTGWSKNFRLGYNTGTESDSLEITGGATLKVGGNSYIGSNPEDKGAGAYQVTVSGAGSSFAGSGAGGDLYLRRDGQLTVKDDASASFSYADIKGSVILENGNFSFIDSRLIGTITMDYASTLTFSGEINSVGGTITIDMTDYDRHGYKLIDYTGDKTYEAADYKILLGEENWNENYAVYQNDLYAITVDASRIGVDDDWAGKSEGDIVAIGDEYFRIGTNAYDNLTEAVAAATADGTTIVVADGIYNESVVVSGNRNLEIGDILMNSLTLGTKDEAFTGSFSMGSLAQVSGGASTTNGSLVLVNGEFTITDYTTAILCLGSSDLVNVSDTDAVKTTYTLSTGSVTVTEHFYVGCADPDNTDRHGYYTMTVEGDGALTVKKTLNVRQDGVFKVTGSSTDVNLSQFLVYGKSEISNNAEVSAFNLQIYNDDNEAQLSVTDSSIKMQIDNLGGTVYIGDRNNRSGSLILERSQLEANIILLGGTDGENQSQLNLNQSNLSVDKTFSITEGGILNLTDSTLTAANTITNNGTINVAGTSTVEAEINGAVNLLDGADVTFAGGAKDLLVASGAEVTLRGELSGREFISEKDHMYNSEGAQGITVNIASDEGTTFQSYAWYASNGSTYNVQSGSSAEITYANINATGTINVAEGATLTTVRESSNIVGTLNVDGTLNSVMTVYAGYTGGAQAGLVNITGTANSSIVTIGTAVRDDDKYNAAAAEGANTTASIVVNGGTFNVTGQEGELTSKLFVGSTDYAGTLSAVNGTINVGARSADGTGYMRFLIGEKGALNLDNSTLTVYNLGGTNNSGEGVFQNSGTINMDLDSQIVTATALENSGTITVDMTGAAEFGVYKLIDYTGSDETAYGNVKFTNNGYEYTASVFDNDLYLVRADGAKELYVNSAWQSAAAYEEVTFVDGTTAYYGLNAFDTVDNAVKSLPADDPIRLNVTGDIGAITVVGKDVTEVNASAKPADITEDTVIDTDAIVVNLVEIDNTDAGWQVYYPLAGGSVAAVYGNVTTNFLSTTFTAWGEKTADPNFIGGAYAGSTATVYGNTTVNLGAADAADDALMLDTSFLIGAGAGTVNGNSSVNINSGTIQANAIVGGGAWRGQVKGDSSVTISGGVVSVDTDPESTGRAIFGGSYGNVSYDPDAPGDPAATAGKSSVTITGDAVVSGKVVGGSDISAVTNSSVTISGQAQVTGNVYGGGNRGGQVKENAAVTIADSAVLTGNVYGGGFGADTTDSIVQGSTSVTLSGGTVTGNVYAGGSNSSVAGDAAVTLTGGTVGGDVYGSGEGSGTVAGASTLNVGAADAAFYTTTLNNVYDFDLANITNAAVTVDGVFAATQISIADSALTLNSGFDTSTTTVSIEVGAYNAENAALVLGSAVGTAPAISVSAGSNALTEARYLVATGFDDLAAFSLEESLAEDYLLRAVDGNIYLYNADAPYFTTELSVTQAEGASVDGNYTFTANFEAEGLLLTGYTLKLYDSATATTPIDEITLGADVVGQEFTFANTVQNFWISVTANGENGQSTDSPTSGRLEVAVQDHDSPVILSVTSDAKSDSVTLACEATDNFGVTGYEFILDGQSLGVQSGSQLALDISNLAAGTHSYTVNVYDAAGNLAGSAEQSFEFTPAPGPGPEPTVPASFLYSSQVRVNNGETVSVYATYSDAAAALEYRIGDSGEWLTYDATTGVNVSSSTTVYFREQGITDPVETAVDVTVVPADVELNAEVILLAPTTDTTYEVIYNFADGGSKAVELSGNSVEHYALPEDTKITIVEKDASGEVVNTIVEETPAASTTAEIPDKVVAVDDGHDNLFFATPIGQWDSSIIARHRGDGTWGGTLESVSLTGKNRFSTVFTGSDDATTLFLTDDANGDVFFLDDIYTANGSDARIRKMSEIQAGAGDDIVDLTSVRYAYEEHASKQLTIRGGDGNDILWGNAGHNIMFGDDGNDKIYGGSDNDVLIGGTGNDTMLGGGGDDIFCYGSSFDWGSDTITQLSGGTVTLYLDGIDRNDCSISGSTLTWNDGTHTGSITLNGVSWDSVKFYCAANGDSDLTKQSDYEELKNKGAFAAISSH